MRSLFIRDSDGPRYFLITGRGVRSLLQSWHVPGVWSNMHRGCQVRRAHLGDLQALADHAGVRLVDQREAP